MELTTSSWPEYLQGKACRMASCIGCALRRIARGRDHPPLLQQQNPTKCTQALAWYLTHHARAQPTHPTDPITPPGQWRGVVHLVNIHALIRRRCQDHLMRIIHKKAPNTAPLGSRGPQLLPSRAPRPDYVIIC